MLESKAEWPSNVNCIHYMRNFCGYDAVNDDDSARKPLRHHKTKRLKITLWRLSSSFVAVLETKSHLLSATGAYLGGKFSTSPTKGIR